MEVDALTDAALKRLWATSFSALSDIEQTLVTIWGLEADINNGGFDQYYSNSSGDQAALAPTMLRIVGADAMASLVERANAAFGPQGPSQHRETREEQLEKISEAAEPLWSDLEAQFWTYTDNLRDLLRRYVETRSNKSLERTREG
jgi:hypothetical protein